MGRPAAAAGVLCLRTARALIHNQVLNWLQLLYKVLHSLREAILRRLPETRTLSSIVL